MATILIVEDSHVDATMVAHMLGKNGYEAICASNGTDAIKIAEESQPDLIVMDVVMPGGIDGFRATRMLRQNPATNHIPVIIASGEDRGHFRQWGFRQGACDYIDKPIKEPVLISKIALHLNGPALAESRA
ncbi:MAG: response regulator [Candidatus Competibacteraceae bacterium]|nr:response regulator [Candidatus Competibacteraceae bacterium]